MELEKFLCMQENMTVVKHDFKNNQKHADLYHHSKKQILQWLQRLLSQLLELRMKNLLTHSPIKGWHLSERFIHVDINVSESPCNFTANECLYDLITENSTNHLR